MKMQILLLTNEQIVIEPKQLEKLNIDIVLDVESAIEKLHWHPYDALLLGDNLLITEQNKIKKIAKLVNKDILVITKEDHQILSDCLQEVIEEIQKERHKKITITDDALINASLNIHLN